MSKELTRKQKWKKFFDSFKTKVHLYDGSKPMYKGDKPKKQMLYNGCNYANKPIVIFQWSEKGRGFGEYTFYEENGKLYCDNECDSKEQVMAVLLNFVNQAIFKDKIRKPKKCKSKVKSNSKLKSSTQK